MGFEGETLVGSFAIWLKHAVVGRGNSVHHVGVFLTQRTGERFQLARTRSLGGQTFDFVRLTSAHDLHGQRVEVELGHTQLLEKKTSAL